MLASPTTMCTAGEDKDEGNPKKVQNTEGPAPLFKAVSHAGNLRTTNAREDKCHDLASPGPQIPTQPPTNGILNKIE